VDHDESVVGYAERMGRKNKQNKPTQPVGVSEAPKLTHSPFADLKVRAHAVQPTSQPAAEVTPAAARATAAPTKPRGRLMLRRETKHRGGKPVIVISGFAAMPGFDPSAIEALAKTCKQVLGCGGTVDRDEIVLQGDRPAQVAELLRAQGFRVGGVLS
jgi:translation initiation factor 1